MALTKITSNLIGSNAISAGNITDASITADDLHATLDLTGKTVTVATASAGDNDTSVASTAFVKTAIDNIIDGAPAGLNTLNEIAASLNDDTGLNTTLVNSIATKAPLANPDFTGQVQVTNAATTIHELLVTGNNTRSTLSLSSKDSSGNDVTLRMHALGDGPRAELFTLSNHDLAFATNNAAPQITLKTDGKVGIGMTVPSTPLHVRYSSAPNSGGNRNTVEDVLTLEATGYFPYGGYGMGINFQGEDYGNTAIRDYGKIQAIMRGHSAQNSSGDPSFSSDLAFWTNTGGASNTVSTEKMRITNTGNVGIGTSNPSSQLVVSASNGGKGIETQVTTHASNNQFILAYDRANSVYLNMELSALNFGIATNNGTNRFKILANGNVGIGTPAPSSLLHIQSNDSTTNDAVNMMYLTALSTGTTTTGFGPAIVFQAERNNGVNQNVGRIRSIAEVNSGTNISSGLSFETGTVGVLDESMRISYSGNVGIGEENPDSLLHTKASNNSAGDLYTGIGPGNAPGITIQNAGTTDSNHATLFFKNDSGHRAHIGAKFVNHTTEQTDLTFGVTDASGNARERLHLKANTNNGADFIGYEGPNATSSTAGDNWHLVADRAMEVKQDNNNASSWIAMKTFTLGANCKSLSIKWAAKNASGTYYWAWRITRNGTVMSMVNHGGGNAQKSFSYGLASGESSSVHSFRSYDVDVGEAFAGDVIQLEMINSTGGGTPVAGTQYLYAKQFLVTSLDKGKIYNGDRGTIRRPMVYGASQFTQTNGNEYDLGSFEFPFRMDSGTHNVLELAEFDQATTANATMQYVGLYGYAARNMGQGIAMASTRRRTSNTDWEDIDGATVHSANGANGGITHPDFYWADGVLKVGVSSSLQITGRIKVTWRQATIQRHWDI